MTHYLRFTDEAAFQAAAETAGFYMAPTDEEPGGYSCYTHDHAMDIVGVIYNDDGAYNPDTGEVITPPTPMPGWHVNYKGTLPDGWDQFLVTPQAPYRVFAGD